MTTKNVLLRNQQGDALHPATSAAQVSVQSAEGGESNLNAEIVKLRATINGLMAASDALMFKGVVDAEHPLPTDGYQTGWVYKAGLAGTYAGQACEVGDMLVCVADYAPDGASNADWQVIQANIDGAVTGPQGASADHLSAFDGTTGRIVKDSGVKTADAADAVAKKHAHDNASTLAKLGEDAAGHLTLDGQAVNDGKVDVACIKEGADIPDVLSENGLVIEVLA